MSGGKGEISPQLLTLIQKYLSGVQFKVSNIVTGSKVMLVDNNGNELTAFDVSTLNVGNSYIGKPSNGDFVTAFGSETTITFSSYPSEIVGLTDKDIEFVRQINSSGGVTTYSRDDANMSLTGDTLTIPIASFTGADAFVVGTNIPRPSGGSSSAADADYKVGSYDGTITYASTTSVTLAGNYPTINYSTQIVYIKVTSTGGVSGDVFFNMQNGVVMTYSGGVVTISGAGTPFATGDTYEVGLNATPIGADLGQDTYKVNVRNSVQAHFADPENWSFTDVTGLQRHIVYMDSYQRWNFQYAYSQTGAQTGTMKTYKSNVNSADTSSLTNWIDCSTGVLGVVSVVMSGTGTTEDFVDVTGPTTPVKYMLEIDVTAAGTGIDVASDAYIRKYY